MAKKIPNTMSDGTLAFSIGNCVMGTAGNVGSYAGFQKYLVKHLRQLGYKVFFDSEYLTSQKFPLVGYQTEFSGKNRIRIKYCKELDIHIHRDIMAAENMADILASKLFGLERPFYLKRQPVRL